MAALGEMHAYGEYILVALSKEWSLLRSPKNQ